MFKNFVKNLCKKIQPTNVKKYKKKLVTQAAARRKEFCFWGITPQPKIGIL
jgi:hypothetical protein